MGIQDHLVKCKIQVAVFLAWVQRYERLKVTLKNFRVQTFGAEIPSWTYLEVAEPNLSILTITPGSVPFQLAASPPLLSVPI